VRGYPTSRSARHALPVVTSLAALLLASASCDDADVAPAQRLWTMADLQQSSHQGTACTNPDDLPCNYFVAPNDAGNDVLQFKLAFSQGLPMGYITTDFWANYDRIWLQPMYFLITAWNENAPAMNRLKDSADNLVGPIFSVGPQSGFYSPYWQVFYVEVPPGTPPAKYTAARQLFDDHLIMHTGANRFASIRPSSVSLPTAADITKSWPNIGAYLPGGAASLARVVASSQQLTGWLDGVAVMYVDFGPDNFDVDANQVILDVPLFLFKQRGADGNLHFTPGASNVGGVAPLFSGVSGRVSASNRPQFGALWRLHVVTLPPAAKVFLQSDEDLAVVNGGSKALLDDKVFRVALDGSCFTSPNAGDKCLWLDSQAAIEDNLGDKAITRTSLLPACPFVMFAGAPVPPQ
jgi:hypothetical protein